MSRTRTAIAMAFWLTASTVAAQDVAPGSALTLTPPDSSRWDASAHLTWLGRHLDQSFGWDRWYEVAAGGAIVGYYWTSHLKTEFDVSTSTQGETYSVEPIPPAFPSFVQRDHEFRLTTASAALNVQFFENAWFHPFAGAGVELIREREHIETTTSIVPPRDPRVPPVISPPQVETQLRHVARPFVSAGFKVYVSERAFIRTDLRTSWASDGVTTLAWRNGFGFDF